MDWLGALTFSGALFCLVLAFIRGGEEGWGSPMIVGLLVAAVVLLAGFVVAERHGRSPMLDLTLFRRPAFTGAQIVAFALSASMFAMFLYLTLYVQNVLRYSPLEAGLRFLPVSLVSFVAAPLAGRLVNRVPVRFLLGGGLAAVGGGLLLMGGISPSDRWTALIPGFILAGLGVGFVNAPLTYTAVGVVEERLSGTASGINSTFRQVGLATAIAALGALFQSRVVDALRPDLAGTGLPPGAADRLGEAVASGGGQQALGAVPAQAREAFADAASRAFIDGLNEILIAAALVAFLGALAALLLVRGKDFVAQRPPSEAEQSARVATWARG